MSLPDIAVLTAALADPASLLRLSLPQWDLLVRQARNADLLAKIALRAQACGVLAQCPEQPRVHLLSALKLAARQRREVLREVEWIQEALAPTRVPFVLLKGAAYALCNLQTAEGRMMSDIDILVPRESLTSVESALMKRGWSSSAASAYDQRYYREWMHELPPMQHIHRGTALDVHHAILPLTARAHPSSAALLAAARLLEPNGLVKVLSPVDMLLHSATHLFHEGELEHGLRGLVDIDSLLREFGSDPAFWAALVPRAAELELGRPLFYAIRYSRLMLATPVPDDVVAAAARIEGALGPGPRTAMMDFLYLRALRPFHASASDLWTPLARGLLYVRGHWLRMPPWLLVVHLTRKLFTRPQEPKSESI